MYLLLFHLVFYFYSVTHGQLLLNFCCGPVVSPKATEPLLKLYSLTEFSNNYLYINKIILLIRPPVHNIKIFTLAVGGSKYTIYGIT